MWRWRVQLVPGAGGEAMGASMRVVILGGGVIGTSIAYHLAARGAAVVVVECCAVACAASGKSGGFLALDWCDGTPLMSLARRSFARHAELAEELGGGWGYRAMTTYAGTVAGFAARRSGGKGPGWVGPEVAIDRRLGSAGTTAQVHPAAFTAAMMRAAEERGAVLRRGRATGLLHRGTDVIGVRLEGEALEADAVVVAMGPWSVLAAEWLALPAVYGLKGHSLVFETGTALPPEALFLEYAEAAGSVLSPEVFPRADGTTYVCGISSESPIPVDPARVAPENGAIDRLKALCARISPVLARSPIVASRACYRPVTEDGLPFIGAIPGARGAYVATGHSVWGILNGPATGEAMAELILDGEARSVDLSPFDPARLAVIRYMPRARR